MVNSMDKIVNLCKNRGYIYPGSDIYGGLANTWDYGPLGVALKNNIKYLWNKKFIQENKHNVGLDTAIFMNPETWIATGHVGGFSDPLIDCKECKTRHRADKLIEEWMHEHNCEEIVDGWEDEKMIDYMKKNHIGCPNCGAENFTSIRKFNLMFKTFQGVTEDSTSQIYLRPETAQGIFVNFKNVLRTTRKKLPMGIGQIGKAFRNEITPGNFTFRTREFEQMELEFFCKPGTDLEWFEYWKNFSKDWLLSLGMQEENIRLRDHSKEELVFYSKATTDIEFKFPFGWGELWGIADRTDYDLTRHMEHSKQDLSYQDPITNEKYVPYVIEPSLDTIYAEFEDGSLMHFENKSFEKTYQEKNKYPDKIYKAYASGGTPALLIDENKKVYNENQEKILYNNKEITLKNGYTILQDAYSLIIDEENNLLKVPYDNTNISLYKNEKVKNTNFTKNDETAQKGKLTITLENGETINFDEVTTDTIYTRNNQ